MLVSGVRSSCEASATNSRCACIICSVSERAASSSRSICSSVRASSPTSSSVSGSGMRCEGSRVVAISRAVAVSAAIGRIARPATAIAGERGEQGAAEHAEPQEEPEPADRAVEAGRCCARTGRRPRVDAEAWSR